MAFHIRPGTDFHGDGHDNGTSVTTFANPTLISRHILSILGPAKLTATLPAMLYQGEGCGDYIILLITGHSSFHTANKF